MIFVFVRGKDWMAVQAKCARLEAESGRDREVAQRHIDARQQADLRLLESLERERAVMAQLIECTKLVGKLRLRHGATEAEVDAEVKRREREQDLAEVDTDRASTDIFDQDALEQRRKDGEDAGFQEL
jgi:hypothetical protein